MAISLSDAREGIGRKVVYHPAGDWSWSEEGVITSVNDTYVFVRYGTNVTSAATPPEQLEWISR